MAQSLTLPQFISDISSLRSLERNDRILLMEVFGPVFGVQMGYSKLDPKSSMELLVVQGYGPAGPAYLGVFDLLARIPNAAVSPGQRKQDAGEWVAKIKKLFNVLKNNGPLLKRYLELGEEISLL